MHIIVDGYNLIRQSDTFRHYERKSLEEGKKRPHPQPCRLPETSGPPNHRRLRRLGGGLADRGTGPRRGVEIIYSRLGEKADEVIKRLLAKGDEEILVVTSDREIATFAVRRGKTAIASTAFDERLERGAAGSFPAESNGKDDTDEDDDRPGMKRKGPSRRLSKQQRAALARIRKL